MNQLERLRLAKELKECIERNSFPLEIRERLENIKRMRKLIQSLGGTIEQVKDEIAKAQNAEQLAQLMLKSLDQRINIPNAFRRKDMDCPIDIKLGNENKGLLHILKRREDDGTLSIFSKEELITLIADCVVSGQKGPVQDKASGNPRIPLMLGDTRAILVKEKKENAWILTAWAINNADLKVLRKLPPDARRSVLLTKAATLETSLVPEDNKGAEGNRKVLWDRSLSIVHVTRNNAPRGLTGPEPSSNSDDTTSTVKAQNNLSSDQRRNKK